eukprot:Gb_07896 [translate_table: standard]
MTKGKRPSLDGSDCSLIYMGIDSCTNCAEDMCRCVCSDVIEGENGHEDTLPTAEEGSHMEGPFPLSLGIIRLNTRGSPVLSNKALMLCEDDSKCLLEVTSGTSPSSNTYLALPRMLSHVTTSSSPNNVFLSLESSDLFPHLDLPPGDFLQATSGSIILQRHLRRSCMERVGSEEPRMLVAIMALGAVEGVEEEVADDREDTEETVVVKVVVIGLVTRGVMISGVIVVRVRMVLSYFKGGSRGMT